MALDSRLKKYFCAVYNYHHSPSDVWLNLLEQYAAESPGPSQAAAQKFILKHDMEVLRDSS